MQLQEIQMSTGWQMSTIKRHLPSQSHTRRTKETNYQTKGGHTGTKQWENMGTTPGGIIYRHDRGYLQAKMELY